jgi:soluble lytic murein transglycosylase
LQEILPKSSRLKALLVGAICVVFVAAGAAAEIALRPQRVPQPAEPIKDTNTLQPLTQAQMESLLAKVAKNLDEPLRVKLGDAILTESARAGFDPLFILALVAVESRFHASAASERGAYGLMQMKPSTFAWIAGREPDLETDDAQVSEDPVIDVRLAVRYFRWLEHRFHSRDEALMAYNAGPKRFQQHKKANDIPDTLRDYPRRVMKEYLRFVQLSGRPPTPEQMLLARAN